MAVVFVHGVNTRKGPSYDAQTLVIDKFVRKHLGGATIGGRALPAPQTSFPYWGDLGMTFAWNMASLPRPQMQALGGTADIDLQAVLGHLRDALPELPKDQPLTALAKKSLPLAVDAINHLALTSVAAADVAAVADFVVAASSYAEANPHPAWVNAVAGDEDLLNQLVAQVQAAGAGVQALGGLGAAFNKIKASAVKLKQAVKNMAGTAVDKAGDFASTKLLASTRDSLNETLGRFFGDVFIYLDGRGDAAHPGPIPSRIIKSFDDALAAAPNEPFVIIGHSLGGVISMDLLRHFRPDIDVDLFVTVGSQVAHFEELKLYRASDPAVRAPGKAKTPDNVRRWINVFDEVDIFSYSVDRVFDRVDVDAPYDTQTYTIKAHGAYLVQDRFYERVRARVDALAH
jgi:hypothetical protein